MTEDLSLSFPLRSTARDEVDLATLVDLHATLLFRVANSVLRNATEAEDVVQDTFVRALHHSHTLPDLRDPRVWLVRIAWNLALDRKRRIRPDQLDTLAAAELTASYIPADHVLAQAEQLSEVFRAIDRLPRAEREALLLCTLDELSPAEVAEIMGKSASAVRALVFRARERIRQRLGRT